MNAEEIILMKMADIVFVDKRSFCYKDFLSFEYNNKEYKFEHGTIRNIFSKLHEKGDIEYEYRSGPTFYTLPGIKFGKSMTVNHTEGHLNSKQSAFLQCLRKIPMDKPAIHDIRLRFKFKHLWNILSSSSSSMIKSKDLNSNYDIVLQPIEVDNQTVKTTVHKTDTVSVIVGCSLNPISIDLFGLARLTGSLARVEDRLQLQVHDYNNAVIQSGQKQQYLSLILKNKISSHMNWIVTMWHFGRDARRI